MKSRYIFLLACILGFSSLDLQGQQPCRNAARLEHLQNTEPKKFMQYMQRQAALLSRFQSQQAAPGNRSIYTIPVVVHVVYKNAGENLSDAQVISQIDVLNEDFARLNADTINTPSAFNVAGPTSFRFCLAQRDPNDNPTTGIERVLTTVPLFSDTSDDVKYAVTGGMDAWDVDRYLNIWVCAMDSSVTGYAEYPDWAPHTNTYGAVVNYLYFGRGGTAVAPFNLGRTATHMVAHCFGMHHIWGDDGGNCTGDDGVTDTPTQADASTGCLIFPATDSCTTGGNGIMFMNYMDNTDDNCKNMFTLGQDGWMDFEMGFSFPTLLNSNGCQAVTLTNNDVWLREILSPAGQSCDLNVSPVVQIKNYGNIAITSVDFYFAYDSGAASLYSWTGNLASLATLFVALPTSTLSAGIHTITVYTTNPNSTADPVTSNDTLSASFELIGIGQALPLTEGFEGVVYPPAAWTLDNPDLDYTWQQTNSAAQSGSFSIFMDNYDYSNVGAYDELSTPIADLSSVVNPVLTFDVAYAYFYLAGPVPLISTDTLEVLVSTDCGANFSRIYFKGGSNLSTALPTDIYFVPTPAQWRNEVVSLSAFAADTQVIVKFRNINGFGNNIYVDDINLTTLTGVAQADPVQAKIYPNPAEGSFTVRLGRMPASEVSICVFDALGRQVANDVMQGTEKTISLEGIDPGIYYVRLSHADFFKVVPLYISR